MVSQIRNQLKVNADRQLKKLTYQLKFLREELLDRNESFQIYKLELRDAVNSYLAELDINSEQESPTIPDEDNPQATNALNLTLSLADAVDPEIANEADSFSKNDADLGVAKELKSIFRKIVLLTHPDKVQHMVGLTNEERHDRFQIYQQACHAFDLMLMDDLIELAVYLGIDVDIPIEVKINKIQSQIKKAEGELSNINSAVEWQWGINFGNQPIRARILTAVCSEMGVTKLEEEHVLAFIARYDATATRSTRRKIGQRPSPRKTGQRPKKR